MERGDLATWVQPRVVFVLEGTLADYTEETTGRWRKTTIRTFHWLPTPIKRLAYLAQNWPDTSIEVITFLDQSAAEEAARFFGDTNIPVSFTWHRPFDKWVNEIVWQSDIHTIYDSDMDRLMRYGQRGYAVVKGEDFH
jgi:hypothetical protein